MNGSSGDDERLRRYLLGDLTEPELEQIEERLLGETELFAALHDVEDELVEGFLDGTLSAPERAGFERHFLLSPEHRQQLESSRVLRDHLARRASSRTRTVWTLGAMIAAVLLLAIGGLWWADHPAPSPLQQAQGSVSPSLPPSPDERASPPAERSLRLVAGRTMGAPAPAEMPLVAGLTSLRLELVLDEDRFERYDARLTADGEVWREQHCVPTRGASGATLVLHVPARRLESFTDYRLILSGESRGGRLIPVASYVFRTTDAAEGRR